MREAPGESSTLAGGNPDHHRRRRRGARRRRDPRRRPLDRVSVMRPGYWLVRCCRRCPEVAARIWVCDHEPGAPDNLVDQPFLQGQLGLDLVPPEDVWAMLEFCEASPEEQAAMAHPAPSGRAPRNGRQPALSTAPMSLWKQQRARRISAGEFERQIQWLKWAERNRPDHPEFNYRRAVDPAAVPIPRFGGQP